MTDTADAMTQVALIAARSVPEPIAPDGTCRFCGDATHLAGCLWARAHGPELER